MAKQARVMPTRTVQTDTLHNLVSGMGGAGDKSIYTRFAFSMMDRAQLENAYRSDWIARKIIDIPAADATREWRDWQADKDDITLLEETEHTFKLHGKLKRALQLARLYGGGGLVLGVDQGNPEDEIVVEKLGKDSLKFVHAVSCHDLAAGPLVQDIMSPWYGEPQYYTRHADQVLRLHPSRVIKFVGAEVPSSSMVANSTWGDPVLQIVRDAITAAGSVSQGIAALIHEAKLDVIKVPDLTAQIANPDYEKRLKARFGLASDAKSIYNMLLLDTQEEWERIVQNFSTLDSILQMYLLMASGAADIPATRLLGQSPAGMNATGESDIRNYYDRVKTEQATVITPAIERLDEIIIRSALGDRPDELHYNWAPLWQLDELQKADLAKKKADVFKIDVDSGVLDGAVLKEARENQLIEDGTYPGIETTIDELGEEFEESTPMLVAPGIDPATGQPIKALPGPERRGPPGNKATPLPEEMTDDERRQQRWADFVTRVRSVDVSKRRKQGRVRMTKDAQPRTLYVRRDVLNWVDIAKHFKAEGFTATTGKSMHVTLAFSRKHVDWMKAGEPFAQDEKGQLRIPPGGVRIVEKLGGATALLFASRDLTWRWEDIKYRTEAEWSWPDYQPHITIAWDSAPDDISETEPYKGEIILGPEVFEEINEDWADLVVEDAKAALLWPEPKRRKNK